MNRAALLAACLLPLLGSGCDRVPMPDWSFLHPPSATPLGDVLPGRWTGVYKGNTYTLTFGRHADVAYVVDVPQEYRARLGTDQLWIGGNYHVEDNRAINCQLTEGRWAVLLAQMRGLELHHVDIKSYTEDEMVDGQDVTWKRIGKAAAVRMGEAVDLADPASAAPKAARAETAAAKPVAGGSGSMAGRQIKLTALFKQLEAERKNLNVKNKAAVAAFNKKAVEYSQQVADFNAATAATANTP